jgi:hypothetical protein
VIVGFRKLPQGACYWEALRGKRTRVPGSHMGGFVPEGRLPHDLGQFVVEAGLGLRYGFWGLVADGATFASMGRRRTAEGRAVIAAHRDELNDAEARVNTEVRILEAGGASPVRAEFDRVAALWHALPEGAVLQLTWAVPLPLDSRRARRRAAAGGTGGWHAGR